MTELFFVGLQLLLIALKLTNKIQWSWWLVLLPAFLYLFFYLFLFVLVGGFLIGIGVGLSTI
ncbi:hypothetical protein [Helicobacter pullorum]|uniref:Uncharacterized protein n=2 Tax=Helicobacter pullorum TaxID=35818 RepID=A0A0N1EHF6_9HELI|nr:hypothetical protein [Helicobacter pullorum]HIS08241.1 hypothetical protein [Candidatus Scatomorpha intestinipullorum]EEQ63953.1 hypothetical protein HPMG_01410 [Helicobacter pullorum MIT 98-5489]KAB0574291.1 hypothetical protein F7P74_07520 [Helicobacter pullorum NCTC 12824]KPH50172.1 hypothetical protein HPU229336_04025 [Helicobacter pullorum]KPH51869.1 hypothetical protein HPU229254_04880 [Helicobacter pullorum]